MNTVLRDVDSLCTFIISAIEHELKGMSYERLNSDSRLFLKVYYKDDCQLNYMDITQIKRVCENKSDVVMCVDYHITKIVGALVRELGMSKIKEYVEFKAVIKAIIMQKAIVGFQFPNGFDLYGDVLIHSGVITRLEDLFNSGKYESWSDCQSYIDDLIV